MELEGDLADSLRKSSEHGLTEEQCKWHSVYTGLMAPSGEALKHPAAGMLLEFATKGCPVDTGPKWSKTCWPLP